MISYGRGRPRLAAQLHGRRPPASTATCSGGWAASDRPRGAACPSLPSSRGVGLGVARPAGQTAQRPAARRKLRRQPRRAHPPHAVPAARRGGPAGGCRDGAVRPRGVRRGWPCPTWRASSYARRTTACCSPPPCCAGPTWRWPAHLVCRLPSDGGLLPLNAVTPLVGVPVVFYVILRQRRAAD